MVGPIRWWIRRGLAQKPFPAQWATILTKYPALGGAWIAGQEPRYHHWIQIFLREKTFVAAGGYTIDDETRVVIAATAIRLILNLDLSYYDRLSEVIVYPDHFKIPNTQGAVLGEARAWGTVILSWQAVISGLQNDKDGHDTATHEFAHILDREAGAFDGTPELRSFGHYLPWAKVMGQNFLSLKQRKRKQRKVLRSYGAQNEAEFFAVATEAFFEKPHQMKKRTPDLYQQLSQFYGFDPAGEK